jgi:uncharacterized membrane protein YfcA
MSLMLGGTPIGPPELLLIVVALLAGGLVKGTIGMGLPLVAVPLLTQLVPVPTAISLLALPIVASNVTIALQTRASYAVLRRLWPYFVVLLPALAVSLRLMTTLDQKLVMLLLGVMVEVLVAFQLIGWLPPVSPRAEKPVLVASALIGGVAGGATSFFAFPGLQALLAMRLKPEEFIFAASIIFLSGILVLGSGLSALGVLGWREALASVAMLVPALLGQAAGRRLQRRLPTALFRRVVLVVMALAGAVLIARASGLGGLG